ncbi:gamma-glutamyl-gamma-aminobutyrate hydrolase family protein [Bariatricus sp. SGI.154]|uniref:gamma-glutamyl-gamma-aminobutyrate hydrolase family protein n=1 Tax=Bariatricus sp. SGI.154 TaxID=3420549 RepID=UPI003D0545B2
MNPIIGIVSCGYTSKRQFVPQTYIHAVESSGGIPIILPCTQQEAVYTSYKKICDGFLFCGGDDVTPLLFGEEPMTDHGKTDTQTDIFHIHFMKLALDSHLPILAICRGMQILNIACNGTIFQDLSLRKTYSLNHMQLSDHREDSSHKISISSNSMLYNILGNTAEVNSFHHQSIHILGTNLKITAIASDGVIEALESTAHPFVIGVQWHPECMYDICEPMQKLFHIFIKKAENAKNIQYISSHLGT